MNLQGTTVQNAFLQAATKAWEMVLTQATEDGNLSPDCNVAFVRVTVQLEAGAVDIGACDTQAALTGKGVEMTSWQRLLSNE